MLPEGSDRGVLDVFDIALNDREVPAPDASP